MHNSQEDQLLLCLSYWREYRTLFPVGMTYGVSKATASIIISYVKDYLIRSKKFNLPKKPPAGGGLD
ncbi:helix-turn-helix domain-containing protein [Acinetobacter silvestris]|uniref:helix-turn-helix domain-containing protein n=1 Tax=Acinetobacter silvestris TaxID=1977882 RepID=UPI00148AD51C|nr:transposase family protein [Acinetobacter silvestris]